MGDAGPVRFVDESGATVRSPLPADWPRKPVTDADEPCPACGGREWDIMRALDASRGASQAPDGSTQPSSFVVCPVCGHEEHLGSWFAFTEEEDGTIGVRSDEGDWEPVDLGAGWQMDAFPEGPDLADPAALQDLDFTVYAASNWPREVRATGSNS